MLKLKAEKTFYLNGRFITEGAVFEADKDQAEELIRRELAKKTKKGE